MLLNKLVHLPVWLFVLIIALITVFVAQLGLYLKYKYFPKVQVSGEDNQSANILIRLVSTLLTVMLAFMVISIWKDYDTQRTNTEQEACVLGNLYRDARGTQPFVEADLQALVRNYTQTVVEDGWPKMQNGQESREAWRSFNNLYGYVIRIKPENKKEEIIYARLINHLNQLATYRRLRHLRNMVPSMPDFMTGIIIIASFVNVVFSYLLKVNNQKMHHLMVGMGGLMLGLAFSLILLLNHPYRGSTMVSAAPLKNLLDDVFPMADITYAQNKENSNPEDLSELAKY